MTKSEPELPGSLLSEKWKEGIGFERKNRSGAFSDKNKYGLVVRLSVGLRGLRPGDASQSGGPGRGRPGVSGGDLRGKAAAFDDHRGGGGLRGGGNAPGAGDQAETNEIE